MRRVARFLGSLLLLGALVALGADLWDAWSSGTRVSLATLGQRWFDLHPASLNGLQVLLERYLWPPLWQEGVFPLLKLPAAPLLGLLALFLLWLGQARRRRR